MFDNCKLHPLHEIPILSCSSQWLYFVGMLQFKVSVRHDPVIKCFSWAERLQYSVPGSDYVFVFDATQFDIPILQNILILVPLLVIGIEFSIGIRGHTSWVPRSLKTFLSIVLYINSEVFIFRYLPEVQYITLRFKGRPQIGNCFFYLIDYCLRPW